MQTRITVFGDSVALGCGYLDHKFTLLPTRAATVVAEKRCAELDNRSQIGQTIRRLTQKKRIEQYLDELNPTKRNVAVLSVGGNDCDYLWQEVAAAPLTAHPCKVEIEEFRTLYLDAIRKLQTRVPVFCVGCTPISPQWYYRRISEIADGAQVLRFLRGDVNAIGRRQEYYNALIRAMAEETNATYLDARSAFLPLADFETFLCDDGIHLSEKGQQLLADSILRQLTVPNDF